MQATKQTTIAIIDDDCALLEALRDLFETVGVSSLIYGSADAFLDSGDLSRVDCVLADVRMPGTSGLVLLDAVVRAEGPPVCMMSSFAESTIRQHALSAGAALFLAKPLNSQDLLEFVAQATSR
ncbi:MULTISPECIES: response regulator [unclassified Rhizobium]|jgi:FixJ family two-component response regulator|uniref:response regulator transcription factor n=1 Tax=unclassified Rhizobium TaxID=2613769 RepID=UPI001621C225|nr:MULTISPECIES: response regulator [unclassified Rhizobium]MBB3319415.1 FixJ family two-component response regulator [Rhizobium sp. BK181]MBB3542231.1 FixJ family two-component response regulator [Rhizobium sp. BK399]MCS3738090.1 FixJ family two-component response regulator [Rhizobium sp. BK661]MCS4092938.1 FixJ family two-component response regulator [Rhizobium sp. BK176]